MLVLNAKFFGSSGLIQNALSIVSDHNSSIGSPNRVILSWSYLKFWPIFLMFGDVNRRASCIQMLAKSESGMLLISGMFHKGIVIPSTLLHARPIQIGIQS